MEIGGAERALLGLLSCLDTSKYNVDLYLCRHSGDFMKFIPPGIRLLPHDSHAASIAIPGKQALSKGELFILVGRTIGKLFSKVYLQLHPCGVNNIEVEYSNRFTYPFVKKVAPQQVYDLAISFLEPHYICAHKVVAKQKIAWMHTDYGAIEVDVKAGYKVWSKFDYIVAISPACQESFAKRYPKLSDRLLLIENIQPVSLVEKQATEFTPEDMPQDGSLRLLSIGRYCNAKNFDNVPDICKKILDTGLNVKWYIIGFGGDEALIQQKIREAHMEEKVILLGKKENPYPYIKACDLYIQPSRYEGKCVTVREAQMLGKPVAITRYATSKDQLEEGVDGVIVPMDNKGCAKEIASLLRDPTRMQMLSKNCRSRDYSNREEVEKLYQIVG